jgi:hypothetical protein
VHQFDILVFCISIEFAIIIAWIEEIFFVFFEGLDSILLFVGEKTNFFTFLDLLNQFRFALFSHLAVFISDSKRLWLNGLFLALADQPLIFVFIDELLLNLNLQNLGFCQVTRLTIFFPFICKLLWQKVFPIILFIQLLDFLLFLVVLHPLSYPANNTAAA